VPYSSGTSSQPNTELSRIISPIVSYVLVEPKDQELTLQSSKRTFSGDLPKNYQNQVREYLLVSSLGIFLLLDHLSNYLNLTPKIFTPELYLSLDVSEASEHMSEARV